MFRFIFRLHLAALVLAAWACVTVNIYFPAAEVERAAESIVDDVYGKQPDAKDEKPGGTSCLDVFLAFIGPGEAWAQDAASVSNAAIRGLKEQMARNHKMLAPFYLQGNIGISFSGLIEILNTDGLAVPQAAQLKQLAAADNQARQKLYKEVGAAMNLDPGQLGKIRAIFANLWREKAPAGYWIQDDSGNWSRK